ncbi:MAG: hypothetical protein A3A43_00345 [Candidatus Liptonbacteria bacterium RIFCSPLOWO2_01_FULL_56_20]|uniref:DNA replication/recombination mediator RecO N-terminal domain-containing protein n=1 Tax=Candidatus Liptonbacteria bacterium RIFCSPLOWO2_01_FULL_56_20 TaxID=1798652 RepID=A0A1G2CKB1_9BACT|nr:MAG: hypothetical protein A2681_02730 [Candidatus Liptonbacteria bacterium RIFCSPHIGHO2_01_FULL_56_18b]OGZ01081.1 MAG: hypothetical protein A3A43_00345 [Candidatus Liptonbacteria bacterium RIFCSPLOWO2_01_FULL_56_20]
MQEYVTNAIVLDLEPNGDLDSRVSLFTKRFGKLVVKVKSAKKVTSKLSPHLQPGNLIQARLVEKNGLHIADALKEARISVPPSRLFSLNQLLAEAEPDPEVWRLISSGPFEWPPVLAALGWDPKTAECGSCGKRTPSFFHMRQQEFYCGRCALKLPKNEVISILA